MMSQDDWKEWLAKQLLALIGQTSEFAHGQWNVYEGALALLQQQTVQITAEWLIDRINTEHQLVHLTMNDPPYRSRHEYRQGRISAYQQMYLREKSAEPLQGLADLPTNEGGAMEFAPHTQLH
jgi:hypothetical protein